MLNGYNFNYVGVYDFDKTPLISALLGAPKKPDVILIKECSTYFPGDIEQYRRSVMTWVQQIRRAGIQPVLVTTAPVREPTGYVERTKSFLKRLLDKPSSLDSITEFNDWMKEYARGENIALFDLEAVLRRSESERWLRAEYDIGDRVHLNSVAYGVMDHAFAEFLAGPLSKVGH
jgi:lysophospholipase L1-like esterase